MDIVEIVGRFIKHFLFGLSKLFDAFDFIKTHKLWKGITRYGWVTKLLVFVGLIIGVKFLFLAVEWWSSIDLSSTSNLTGSLGDLARRIQEAGYGLFFMGGVKYLILILMEVVIFHFVRKTISILKGEDQEASFKSFVQAEIRMIKVSFAAWIMESVISFLVSLGLGIAQLDFLKSASTFGIQCYFLGWVVIDNYFELYSMKIKKSLAATKFYAGLSVVIGLAMYILLLIPLLGAVLAPLFGSVAATLAMYDLHNRNEQFEIVPPGLQTDNPTISAVNFVDNKTYKHDLEDHYS